MQKRLEMHNSSSNYHNISFYMHKILHENCNERIAISQQELLKHFHTNRTQATQPCIEGKKQIEKSIKSHPGGYMLK